MAELRVMGISLGSPTRDFRGRWEWAGGSVDVWRTGTGGDVARAMQLLAQYDGRVDAYGLGGVNLFLQARGRRYPLPLGEHLAAIPGRTPVCDGSYIKTWWEPFALGLACEEHRLALAGRRVLFSSALDRWPLAEALERRGARLALGDAAFALRLPVLFPGLDSFYPLVVLALPFLRHLPLARIYPLGTRREECRPGFVGAFQRADVLAGDFHFLRTRLPEALDGKWVIATGLGEAELAVLKNRGVSLVLELGPVAAGSGRGFSANLAEAVVVAASGESPRALGAEGVVTWCRRLGFRPTVYRFGSW